MCSASHYNHSDWLDTCSLTLVNQLPRIGVLVDEGILPHIPRIHPDFRPNPRGFHPGNHPGFDPYLVGGPGTLFDEVLGTPILS